MQEQVKIDTKEELKKLCQDRGLAEFSIPGSEFPVVVVLNKKGEKEQVVTYVSYSAFEHPDFINKIQAILSWYRSFTNNGSPTHQYPLLLRAKSTLAQLNADLGSYKALLDSHYTETIFARRRARDKEYLKMRQLEHTVADARASAQVAMQEYERRQIEAQRSRTQVSTLYDTVLQVLNAMANTIKALEREYNYAGQSSKAA